MKSHVGRNYPTSGHAHCVNHLHFAPRMTRNSSSHQRSNGPLAFVAPSAACTGEHLKRTCRPAVGVAHQLIDLITSGETFIGNPLRFVHRGHQDTIRHKAPLLWILSDYHWV